MLAALLISAFVLTLIALWRGTAERAVLSLFLPVMMLWPYGSGWKFKGVELDVMDMVAVPIMVALVVKYGGRWQYRFTDLLMVLYCFSSLLSNWNSDGQSAGLVLGVSSAFGCLPPYIIGRVVLEREGNRIPFIKRLAFLAFLVSLLSVYEYRMESNPFRELANRLYGYNGGEHMQVRWGFGRIAGPYGHAILAGCLLLCALIFALWLSAQDGWGRHFRRLQFLPGRKSAYILLGLALGVWMTQSRGPWMGGAFGILLLLAGRARNRKRAFRNVVLASLLLGTMFYVVLNRYTDISQSAQSQDQENAQYRRLLLVNYAPEVQQGGLLGWGIFFPKIDGQTSIDNEYLNITLSQGYLGVGVFLTIILVTGYRLVHLARSTRDRTDGSFAFCLLGIFSTIVVSITTVYLGMQAFTLFFLVVGWTQALKPAKARAALPQATAVYPPVRFAFRRVWS